jgi:flagellin
MPPERFTEDLSMSFSVNTNLASLNSQITLERTDMHLQRTLARLSSGLRINSSADDAAGLAVANRHRLDYTGLTVGMMSPRWVARLQRAARRCGILSPCLMKAITPLCL